VIRRARLAAGLTQSEVASEIGVEQSTVSVWEGGRAIPTVPLFGELVAVLGPWPLLDALLSPDQLGNTDARVRMSGSRRRGSGGGVGASIRAARQAAGLTQAQLGVRVGVQQSAVGQWERGRTLPTLPLLRRLVGVLGPWPLLEALLPSGEAGPAEAVAAVTLAPRSPAWRPSREELARLVRQERRSDQELADRYGQPLGIILRWRRAYGLVRAAPPPRTAGRPPRPSREELARLAIQEGRSDQELADRYGRSVKTIKSWRALYGLARKPSRVDRARLLALWRQDIPAGEIAQEVGCTPRTVYKIAKAAGIHEASGPRLRARRQDPVDRAQVLAMWRQGAPVGEIAEAVGCKPGTVYKIAEAAGAYVISGQRPAPGDAARPWPPSSSGSAASTIHPAGQATAG
jgi:transcriptional regulator with XRE-family HTH domain/DNA-binding CsgD family transcriptional regulator